MLKDSFAILYSISIVSDNDRRGEPEWTRSERGGKVAEGGGGWWMKGTRERCPPPPLPRRHNTHSRLANAYRTWMCFSLILFYYNYAHNWWWKYVITHTQWREWMSDEEGGIATNTAPPPPRVGQFASRNCNTLFCLACQTHLADECVCCTV